jgi:hypothetical protein
MINYLMLILENQYQNDQEMFIGFVLIRYDPLGPIYT